jgi:LysM repeat protein
MLEWLRLNIFGPMVINLAPLPPAARYGCLVFLFMLPLYLVPMWILFYPISSIGKLLTSILAWIVERTQRAAGNRSYGSSALIDILDRTSEAILNGLRMIFTGLETLQTSLRQRGRLRKRWLLILPLVLISISLIRPSLGRNDIGNLIDMSAAQVGTFERWAAGNRMREQTTSTTSTTQEVPEPVAAAEQSREGQTDSANAVGNGVNDPIHIVERGQILRTIASRYRISTQCIMKANAKRYPNQNWDSLSIGQELAIPTSDPNCQQ